MNKFCKIILIFVFTIFLVSCSNGSNKADENKPTEESNEPVEQKTTDILVWDVSPMLEFDDIDNWLTTRKNDYSGFLAEGASPDYLKPSDYYSVSYNRDDFYNSEGKDGFVIGSFEKGGLMVKKDGKWGLMNYKGEIVTEITHNYKTHMFLGTLFSDRPINHDYTLKDKTVLSGTGTGTGPSLLYINVSGDVYAGDENTIVYESNKWVLKNFITVNLFDDAVKNGYVDEDDFLVLNTYAGMIDHEKYFPETKLPTNCIETYVVIDKSGFKLLDVPSNYVINDFSDDIISFAECTTDPRLSQPTIYELGTKAGDAFSRNYYAYELYCDKYNYRNFTFINRDGDVIAKGFEDAYGFYDGYAAVKNNGKWGFIDKQGSVVVDFVFDKATAISEGKSWVIYKGKTGRLNICDLLSNGVEINRDTLDEEKISIVINS